MENDAAERSAERELLTDCQRFANRNLSECAKELIEWQDTGILSNGKVRELAEILKGLVPSDEALRFAQRLIEREALEYARSAPDG